MKTSLTTSFLILLCAAFFLGAPVKAQDSCTLKLKVVNVDSGAAISGANVLMVELDTKEFFRRVSEDGVAIFAGLRNAVSYEMSVVKSGYKQTIDRMKITCLPQNQMTAEIEIGLQKGKLKETYSPVRAETASVKDVPGPVSNPGPTASPDETPKIITRGVVNGLALRLARPVYPASAKAVGIGGAVPVRVLIDEKGKVISAEAIGGHPLLRLPAVAAARDSNFKPVVIEGKPVKVSGTIIYNFR